MSYWLFCTLDTHCSVLQAAARSPWLAYVRGLTPFEKPLLQTIWENKSEDPKYAIYHDAINDGLMKLKKYYSKFDKKPVYFLSLALPCQPSSVPSEQLFSCIQQTVGDRRSRLRSDRFEELEIFGIIAHIVDHAKLNSQKIERVHIEDFKHHLHPDSELKAWDEGVRLLRSSLISAPRAYGFVGHISHQDKISATRQARRAHPQAHTTASDRINTHDNGQDQLAAPHIYDARPSHSYRTLSQLSTYGIAPQHGSARTQYFLTRDPNAPRPTPTATRTNITARASMRPGHLDNVPIR
ncbi:hypothetical protein BD779DRAFT_1809241 [Infundibulicybe gibba]|nr:hypothetical protein BD779DRAFT_1809241 [Infundibulicybe gibba]